MHPSQRQPRRIHARASLILFTSSLLFAAAAAAQVAPIPGAAATTQAEAAKPVKAELTQMRVVTDAKGVERLEAAPSVKPGDVLEYRVKYTNAGKDAVKGVKATLPIPEETEYLAKTGKPDATRLKAATRDGKYAAEPLMHTPAGKAKPEAVPYADYRTLQWDLGQLPAGGQTEVSARVRVLSVVPPVAAAPSTPASVTR